MLVFDTLDISEFVRRMKVAAQVENYMIGCRFVRYYDPQMFHGHFPGLEAVFWNQDQKSYLRELRFAIVTGSTGDSHLTLEIGDISDIAMPFDSVDLNSEKLLGGDIKIER